MEAPRPSVRYQRLRGSDSEEAAEPVVSVLLYSQSMRGVIQEKHRETCVRIFTALLLLAVALSFAFYQLTHGSVAQQDPEEEKWAFVDDADWNNTWESDSERHQHGKEGKTGYDEENERGHHHDEEEEAGHHHGDEEEPGHNHEEEEQADEPPAGHTHEHGVYQHATVITDSEICSSVGKGILTAGGNIVDAGISALLCLGVVHPHTAGIGGVFSAIFYNRTAGSARALNAISTQSPSRRFGIPLVLQGLWVIHQQYGSMAWPNLFERPIQMSEKGFEIDGILARALQESDVCVKSSGLRDLFCSRNGSLKREGALSSNLKLAEMLQSAASFMKGPTLPEVIVQNLYEDLSPEGLSSSDRALFLEAIKTSTVAFESPLSVELDGFKLYGTPPPASGNIIGDILKEVDRNKETVKSTDLLQSTADTYFHILNASKHSYTKVLGGLLHGRTATASIGQSAVTKDFMHLEFANVGSHISTADSHGNMFLISTSLNSSFGSKFISPSTGIILSDFAVSIGSNALFWACPVVVKLNDEEGVFGVGAAGGSTVPLSVVQSIINHIYLAKPLKDVASGPILKLNIGEDGAFHTSMSGISNTSDFFLSLLDKGAEVTAVNDTDGTIPVVLVESHAEHAWAFGSPPSCCHLDGF